jgi:hypothetical protein
MTTASVLIELRNTQRSLLYALRRQHNKIECQMSDIEDRLFIVCDHDWTEDVSGYGDDGVSVCKTCGCASDRKVSHVLRQRKERLDAQRRRTAHESRQPEASQNDTGE